MLNHTIFESGQDYNSEKVILQLLVRSTMGHSATPQGCTWPTSSTSFNNPCTDEKQLSNLQNAHCWANSAQTHLRYRIRRSNLWVTRSTGICSTSGLFISPFQKFLSSSFPPMMCFCFSAASPFKQGLHRPLTGREACHLVSGVSTSVSRLKIKSRNSIKIQQTRAYTK